MQVVWVIEGPYAGKFHPFPDEIAKEMIENGTAQKANSPAHLARKPKYATREMIAENELSAPSALKNQPSKKKKKNRK